MASNLTRPFISNNLYFETAHHKVNGYATPNLGGPRIRNEYLEGRGQFMLDVIYRSILRDARLELNEGGSRSQDLY